MIDKRIPSLYIYITYFQGQESQNIIDKRFESLATSIFYLSQIRGYRISLLLVSNKEVENFLELKRSLDSRVDNSTMDLYVANLEELSFEGRRFDWLLTWVHKNFLRRDFESLKLGSEDLFLVLEDDALFTESNLNYFLEELPPLSKLGLIPSYVRSEWSNLDKCWTHEDPCGRIIDTRSLFNHPETESKVLMQLINPFSASILLNYELAVEYLNSESSYQHPAAFKHPVIYDIGSTATLGLICENVPAGFINRVAVVCNPRNNFPIPGSVIRHLGDRYAKDKWHRNIRLYDKVDFPELPHNRKALDYILRLLKKDGIHVLKTYATKVINNWTR